MDLDTLATPALIIDVAALDANIATMAARWPGSSLRPHVKAFKSTDLARRLADAGHRGFCCATVREVEGMASAGLGDDLLLANEVLDARRIGALVQREQARVTVAVDSTETVRAAADAGVREVLIDVNVGLPRCGCTPDRAGSLADEARRAGLDVRGVMGYEGHVVGLVDPDDRASGVQAAMELLTRVHAEVGGEIVSGGGTGTWDHNRWVTELQAGSYTLMDTAYGQAQLPFRQAAWVLGSVISTNPDGYAVADVGLKALGMDHGNPHIEGHAVWFCSDEHITFAPRENTVPVRVGDRVRVTPAHIDPTVALHERMWLVDRGQIAGSWPVDLRGW